MNQLPPHDRRVLGELGIETPEQLADHFLHDNNFITRFSEPGQDRVRVIVRHVVRQRSAAFLDRSHSFTDGGVLNYRLDFLIAIAVLLIFAALWRDSRVPSPPVVQKMVAKTGGLPPFHVIVREDLRLSCETSDLPSPDLSAPFVGRFSNVYLNSCETIDPKKLSAGPALSNELNGRLLLTLKLQQTTLFAGVPPPFKAALMISPREHGAMDLLLKDVLVLDLQKGSSDCSAVVAIPSADESTLASFVARSDLLLVEGPP